MKGTVGIVGGGPAGLALADDLSRADWSVTLFEAAPELGGLARSFRFGDISIERYYHFICAGDTDYFSKISELGIADRLRWNSTRMGFFFHGKMYPFSSALDLLRFDGISLGGRLRYGLLALRCSWTKDWRQLDLLPAEPWLIQALGRAAYQATWYPLLRVKFDTFHDQISAAWVWHRIQRVAQSRRTPFHRERLGYLAGGTDTLVTAIEAGLIERQVRLCRSTPVRRIEISDGRARGIETMDGERHPFDIVVSTVPLPHLVRMAPELPADYLKGLEAIRFIGVVCVALRLRERVSENFWLNVNDDRIPFNGCIEYTNLNAEMTPDGTSILYVPFYLPLGHPRFKYTDEQLVAECVPALQLINPRFNPDWILHSSVSRDPYAQVICGTGFAAQVPAHRTPIENLYLIESSQLYPSDRTISGTIGLARKAANLIQERPIS
jgi:protoporphyrinogen oxidase